MRHLDRRLRQVQRLERDTAIGAETLGLFIRLWMTATPSLPHELNGGAEARGTERFQALVAALADRLNKGASFFADIPIDAVRECRQRRRIGRAGFRSNSRYSSQVLMTKQEISPDESGNSASK